MESANTTNNPVRSIEMFFGRCKRENEAPISIKEMDEAIMQAVEVVSTDAPCPPHLTPQIPFF